MVVLGKINLGMTLPLAMTGDHQLITEEGDAYTTTNQPTNQLQAILCQAIYGKSPNFV